MRDRFAFPILAFAFAFLLAPTSGSAATRTFDGGVGGAGTTLDTAANWTADTLPTTSDEALLDNSIITLSALTTSGSASYGDLLINSNSLTSVSLTGGTSRNLTLTGSGGSTAAVAAGGASGDLLLLGTNVTGGVTVGGGSGAGKLNLALGGDGNFNIVNAAATANVTGIISGAFNLTKTGSGTLSLSGANTFGSGKTLTLSAGTIVATTSANALGAGVLQLNSGTLVLQNDTGLIFNRNTTVGGATTIKSDVLSSGSAGVTHTLGTLNIGAFQLNVTKGGNVGSGTAGLTFGATTLTGNAIVDTGAGTNLTLGSISGVGLSLTKQGSGMLTLSSSSSFSGGFNIAAGTVVLGNNVNALGDPTNLITLGAVSGSASATLSSGVSLTFTQNISVANGNTGIMTIGNTTGGNGNPTKFSGTLSLNNHDVTIRTDVGLVEYSGTISGTGNLTAVNTSTTADLKISGGVNTVGNITINNTGTNNVLFQTLAVNNTGTITNQNGNNSITSIVGGNVAAIVQDDGGTGLGSLTLSGSNSSFAGTSGVGVTVRSGTVIGSNAIAFGTGAVNLGITSGSSSAALLGAGFTFSNNVTVQAGNSGTSTIGNSGNSSAVFSGLVTVNHDLVVAAQGTGSVNLSGTNGAALTGTGNITLTSATPASNTISLNANNSGFTGSVTVNSGSFRLTSSTALSSANTIAIDSLNGATLNINANNQTIAGLNNGANGGGTVTNTGSLRILTLGGSGTYSFGGAITATTPANLALTVNLGGAGKQILSGSNIYTGTTTITAGTLQLGIGGTTGALAVSSTIVNNGTLAFNRSNTVTQGTDFANSIGGSGGLTQAGSGTLVLGGTNSYSGATAINSGILSIGGTAALKGTTGVTLGSGAGLTYTGTADTFAKNITVSSGTGTVSNTGGALLALSGTLSKNGSTLRLTGGAFNVTGPIVGASANSDLLVDAASVTLSGSNSYNGPTFIINSGTLTASAANALPTANGRTAISLDQSGSGTSSLVLGGGFNQTIASLTGAASSGVNLNAATLTVGTSAGSTTFAGVISGANGSLIKDGNSTQILSGNNSYTGTTTVSAGTLLINGNQTSATGTASVSNGATLGGSGTLGGNLTVTSGGTLAPGNGTTGNLTVASLTLNSGAVANFEISGTGAGTFDSLTSAGALSLNGTFNLIFNVSLANNASIDLFPSNGSVSGNFSSVVASGNYTGSFSNVGTLWTVTSGGQTLSFEATTGVLSAVPEPSTVALSSIGLAVLLYRFRSRSKKSRH